MSKLNRQGKQTQPREMGKEDRAMNIDRHVMLADEIDILRVYI